MKKVRRKEVIYRAGDRAEAIYQLERGLVRIVEILPDGRQLTLRHVLPGDYFGEEALSERQYRYTAEALTEAAAYAVDPRTLSSEELRALAANLASQMVQVQAYETHLQWGELRSRICRYLLYLASTAAKGQDERGAYVTASHEEIADATASTRESVSKLLSDLRHEGILDTGYRRIYLVDRRRLELEAESRMLQAV
ncbi:MAG: cyclic nucleotide-binding domain-containing protein [Meiothermus sp.]|uniref:cyclic nucleotide-binding domain-containing protein n=1 Tax=Meiothermus sp. TaxID=1955249 RepID=UPI0025E0F02C|nr:cyclic nucleotide-binding domain-containing protein [Meiothermus sp.]MCS7057767.1 cyclic nucleotide-binding domain-containing protein [Meiothermus sp.]MCS7194610.1 cyclic nucleotide-binding domain-containing protein [Meiothermus sp.]MCX7740799.1 cyclic nucleotide-binding domain-containing protein [Meiothermus sp.]MDW8090981.1 cyclic nucleotide-binding domain-containing protein [Meiothermus sp.]MDW8481876.1 cyclic nucleotide-binding domain-containing protein [Meiothermus sp.]